MADRPHSVTPDPPSQSQPLDIQPLDPMSSSYTAALAFLYPRTTTIKFGLERTVALLESLGRPDRVIPVIHIGGTNGKGSVATLVAAALGEAGWRVGLYTSPHLVSFRERYRVADVPISEDAVAMWVTRLRPQIEAIGATFFESGTAIAFADFAASGAEIAVVEVGLGGRLDSTNVVRPLVSAVTKIEMDHQKYLGNTLEAIAREKAGIAKPGATFIVGETKPEITDALVGEAERLMASDRMSAPPDIRIVPPAREWQGPLGLLGRHQRRNATIAESILEALPQPYRPDPETIARAFAQAHLPGRLDRRGRWWFDVAHNPDGMESLVAAIEDLKPAAPIHALVSILGDKEWPEMLVALDRVVDRGILTIAPSTDVRRWDLVWLEKWLGDPQRPPATADWSLVRDFDEAIRRIQVDAGSVLVTGSFHTVGDVMAALGLAPI
ncbi:MAG: bifunctional folylpolyglutamate synthase/dihydrofolate synthase [Gemmatimonadales bacterium]|nr:MAG: bifunctional folylpolyglutamate synthase/dihydrofolate synthase [Gemmatimonadales bacterium]